MLFQLTLTVHSLSQFFYSHKRKSKQSECEACRVSGGGGGGVSEASQTRIERLNSVDNSGKRWFYEANPPVITLSLTV